MKKIQSDIKCRHGGGPKFTKVSVNIATLTLTIIPIINLNCNDTGHVHNAEYVKYREQRNTYAK